MSNSVATIQATVAKIAELIANTPFEKDHATMAVLLSEAKLKLESGAQLEAEILATIQAIIDTFEAQSGASVAEMEAAGLLLQAAKDDLVANAASLTDTNTKVTLSRADLTALVNRPSEALAVGTPGSAMPIMSWYNNYESSGYSSTCGIRPAVIDHRDGSIYQVVEKNNGPSDYNNRISVMRYKAGVWTQLVTFTYEASILTGEIMQAYLLPLARSATNPTTVLTLIFLQGGDPLISSGTGYSTVQVRNADNWSSPITLSAAQRPRSFTCHGYDFTNKTFVYVSGSAGTIPWGNSSYPVRELFADGTSRDVTVPATGQFGTNSFGSVAFGNLMASSATRYFTINGPLNGSANSARVNGDYKVHHSAGDYVTYRHNSGSTPHYEANLATFSVSGHSPDGAYRRQQWARSSVPIQHDYYVGQSNFNQQASDLNHFLTTASSSHFSCPQWEVSVAGSPSLKIIRYTPEVQYFDVMLTTNHIQQDYGIKGVSWGVFDRGTGLVEGRGYAPVMSGPMAFTAIHSGNGGNGTTNVLAFARKFGVFHPLAINGVTNEAHFMVGHKAIITSQSQSFSADTNMASGTTYYTRPLAIQPMTIVK